MKPGISARHQIDRWCRWRASGCEAGSASPIRQQLAAAEQQVAAVTPPGAYASALRSRAWVRSSRQGCGSTGAASNARQCLRVVLTDSSSLAAAARERWRARAQDAVADAVRHARRIQRRAPALSGHDLARQAVAVVQRLAQRSIDSAAFSTRRLRLCAMACRNPRDAVRIRGPPVAPGSPTSVPAPSGTRPCRRGPRPPALAASGFLQRAPGCDQVRMEHAIGIDGALAGLVSGPADVEQRAHAYRGAPGRPPSSPGGAPARTSKTDPAAR